MEFRIRSLERVGIDLSRNNMEAYWARIRHRASISFLLDFIHAESITIRMELFSKSNLTSIEFTLHWNAVSGCPVLSILVFVLIIVVLRAPVVNSVEIEKIFSVDSIGVFHATLFYMSYLVSTACLLLSAILWMDCENIRFNIWSLHSWCPFTLIHFTWLCWSNALTLIARFIGVSFLSNSICLCSEHFYCWSILSH